jgi:hypothetical protein
MRVYNEQNLSHFLVDNDKIFLNVMLYLFTVNRTFVLASPIEYVKTKLYCMRMYYTTVISD